MITIELPETVRQAWGPEASKDFTTWLEAQLSAAGLAPGVQISALVARQKVNVLTLERISHLLLAGEPGLVQTEQGEWVWRVPVDLTFPGRGRVGRVGEIEVEAHYGEVRYTEALLAQITQATEELAQKVLHPQP